MEPNSGGGSGDVKESATLKQSDNNIGNVIIADNVALKETNADDSKPEKPEEVPIALCNENAASTSSSAGIIATATTTATGGGGKGGKNGAERKASVTFGGRLRCEIDKEVMDYFSTTKHKCLGTRTSARVKQKMEQDQIRPITPPNDRDVKKEEKTEKQKTPSQVRTNKPTWTNVERNHFFDALNELGKDFEAIGNYINAKLKRKCATDISFKPKDQVRQHYFQTYHKICKYIKFSDEIKKPAQELYALINYGEMRRKLQYVTDKHFMKLKNLVYQGHITVRCKGKNIRIKTPSCKALRRLNQLDDSLEDIRLPSKIEVIVSPANMESFGRVQTIAQNPRARTTVPLHKKLINFIQTFQMKWRSQEMRLAEEELKLYPLPLPSTATAVNSTSEQKLQANDNSVSEKLPLTPAYQDPEMCFVPKSGAAIHRPLLSITEYLSSVNICLTAYEERMGVKVRGETLGQEQQRQNNKRQRTESGSEKRSPDTKKPKQICGLMNEKLENGISATEGGALSNNAAIKDEALATPEHDVDKIKCESSGDELSDEINELLCEKLEPIKEETLEMNKNEIENSPVAAAVAIAAPTAVEKCTTSTITTTTTPTISACNTVSSTILSSNHVRTKRSGATNTKQATRTHALIFKPLITEEVIRSIRKGWTVSNAADITIGDLYVVLGHDTKLELEYYWTDKSTTASTATTTTVAESNTNTNNACINDNVKEAVATRVFTQKQNGMPYNPTECDDPVLLKTLSNSTVCNKLKHLLLIANLSERMRKRQCTCGHTCDRNVVKTRFERDLASKSFVANKSFSTGTPTVVGSATNENNAVFRQPIVPIRRPIFNMDPVKQLNTLTRPKMSRQVLVQRLLMPGGSAAAGSSTGGGGVLNTLGNQPYDFLQMKNLQNNLSENKEHINNNNNNILTTAVTSGANFTVSDSNNANETNHTIFNLPYSTAFPYDSMSASPISTAAASPSSTSLLSTCSSNNNNMLEEQNNTMHQSANCELSTTSTLPDSAFDDCTNTSLFNGMSPSHFLRDSTSNSRWLEDNLNDFSLTSLLGHLDEINSTRDILDPSSNLSVISESSVDYMHKFQEITALMQSQDKD